MVISTTYCIYLLLGWFDKTTFEDWFFSIALKYCQQLKNDKPRVLIGDNVSSHLSAKVINCCLENNIRLVFLPPNATHLCQPLDVSFFRPLKRAYKETLEEWKKRAKGVVPKHVFPGLLKKALERLGSNATKNMKSGFRASGICPLNPNAVMKKIPGGAVLSQSQTSSSAAPAAVKQENSFSEHLVTLLKKERFGSPTDRAMPKRKRLVDIQPGESVSAEHAAKIMSRIKTETTDSNDDDRENVSPKKKKKKDVSGEETKKKVSSEESKKENVPPKKKKKKSVYGKEDNTMIKNETKKGRKIMHSRSTKEITAKATNFANRKKLLR